MNRYKYYFGALTAWLLLVVTLVGCYKDKGNYDYIDLNEFTIGELSPLQVEQGALLKATPVLTEEREDESRFDYRWLIELTQEQMLKLEVDSMAILIGNKKNLEYTTALPLENFVLKFEAVDKTTGVRKFTSTKLQVLSVYQRGYMLLEETANGGDISLVNGDREFRHLFSQNNNGKYIPTPLGKFFSANISGNKKPLFVTGAGYAKELDELSFRIYRDMNEAFFINPGKSFVPMYFSSLTTSFTGAAFIWDTGEISHSSATSIDMPVIGDYQLAPYLGHFGNWTYIGFDKRKGRFLSFNYNAFDALEIGEFIYNPTKDAFDMNAVSGQMVFGSNIYQNKLFGSIIKDPSAKLWYYELEFVASEVVPKKKYQLDLNKVPFIDQSTLFAASGLLPQLYYAVGNKVYLFDLINESAVAFLTFPANEQVTTLEWANKEGDRQVVISTFDGSEGRFYVFQPNSAGTFGLPAVHSYSGFGKIVDTHIKYNVDSPR